MLNIRFTENSKNSKQKIKKIKKSKINVSNFGGILVIDSVWKKLGLGNILKKVGINKQKGNLTAEELALVCINQPLIGARFDKLYLL